MSVYLCQKCDKWYKTKVEWKNHKCDGLGNTNPSYFEKPKEDIKVKGMVNSVPEDASLESILTLDRPDLIAELKEKGIIDDARKVKSKSDEELSEMLKSEG